MRLALTLVLVISLVVAAAAQRAYDVKEAIRFDQNLDAQLPLDATFLNEEGKSVRLGEYFDGERPVVMLFAFYQCAGVCAMEFQGLIEAINGIGDYHAGLDYRIINVGIHPKEVPELANAKRRSILEAYRRPGAEDGIHMLVGDRTNILRVTDAAGFKFHYDEASNTIDHAAGLVILTPDGRISRYIFGVKYPSKMLRDSLMTAEAKQIGVVEENISWFVCWAYDPTTGQYRLIIQNLLKVMGVLTVFVLATSITVMSIRQRNRVGKDS